MKKLLHVFFLALASSLLVTGLSAQNILCVDRDFGDDTTSGDYTNTWHYIDRALQANGHMADYWEVIDPEEDGPPLDTMSMYDIVIWFTGEAWTDLYTMTDNDENNLVDFLLTGGKLFLNAQDYLYDRYGSYGEFDPTEFPYIALGLEEVVQDVYHIEVDDGIADSARFYGLPGSLAEGLEFPTQDIFTTPDEDGLYGDSLAQHRGTGMMGILEPYNSVGPAAIQYEDQAFGFRSVFSTIDIAAITDTVARDILMGRIVEWLMYGGVGLSEINAEDVNLTISPNPVKDIMRISMNCDMDHIWIYNMHGQVVRHEVVGNNILSLDISDLRSGLYIFRAISAEGVVSSKLLKR